MVGTFPGIRTVETKMMSQAVDSIFSTGVDGDVSQKDLHNLVVVRLYPTTSVLCAKRAVFAVPYETVLTLLVRFCLCLHVTYESPYRFKAFCI